ncbi:signal recognition particle protein [Candidatus Chlamydia corallus]|uniref:signal recognition particle protein n=1 Tax=Candidatus Chlamydia corallus TaxID=2038470 RepID=UPI000C2FAC14|nr:signal recognition particle protein [Candidatus Chlamydia corallus]
MINSLSQKLSSIFSSLVSSHRINEENISESIREVRLALLDADVNYHVVKDFISKVKEKVLGEEIWKHVSPGQQFIRCLHEELVSFLSDGREELTIQGRPWVILLCGLQGAGKTTTAAKLADYVISNRKAKKVLVVPCDLKRFAALEQLKILISQTQAELYESQEKTLTDLIIEALAYAKKKGHDLVILDTAGRLNVDNELMEELATIQKVSQANERLFVMNLAMGQDIIAVAQAFDQSLDLTGVILSMTDGDARAGAVFSIKHILGKPIKFEGCGERIQDLRSFDPQSMAERILGMGDTVNFVKEMRQCISEEEDAELGKKFVAAAFTYEDYYKQMKAFRRMGPLKKLLGMMPGFNNAKPSEKELENSEKHMKRTEAIILSMTPEERTEQVELDMSRMKRIASGCGLTLGDVNQFRKQMLQSKKFFKGMSKGKMEQVRKKMSGGNQWR